MDIRDIFENRIKIESKVMSIESLFNNKSRVRNTDFKPSYQRNYVWSDEKASYFIESILLGTEIPPLVFFRNGEKVEVIDGRQRYQTILRFKSNEFKLRKNGLQKLGNVGIANKAYKDLDLEFQDLFWDTKLRIIEFSLPSKDGITEDVEELVKREIFKRYNSGITPLKPSEIDNAVYLDDDLNAYLKEKIQNDEILNRDITNVFHFEKNDIEVILKRVRQLLVQHKIPIKYYAVKKQIVVSKFYDALYSNIDDSDIEEIYKSFIEKLNLLVKIKTVFVKYNKQYNRLISECLFWAFSILEEEGESLKRVNDVMVIDRLVNYLIENIESFSLQSSSFAKELYRRYRVTTNFFEEEFDLTMNLYLETSADFLLKNNSLDDIKEQLDSFEELRINKPEPSSIAITDIIRLMERQRFLIRPQYQRKEVINKKKSSAIIESILLGIKIPPIFVFKREDGIREVLDGQQRILSILGFTGDSYLNEKNEKTYSNKNEYSLYLRNSILNNLHGAKYNDLSLELQDRVKNSDLWLIEIDKKYNKNFEPIDLFVRLNDKPYPIKEDTFEMWNSYISRDIIDTIKAVHRNHKNWFYFRKNNSRMEDENIYTALAFLQYSKGKSDKSEIDIYKNGRKINFRLRSKNEITKVLESIDTKVSFIEAINDFEFEFIRKLRELLSDSANASVISLNDNLDSLFLIENSRRTQQSFYALWYFLNDISIKTIVNHKFEIRKNIKKLFDLMKDIDEKSIFEHAVSNFKRLYAYREVTTSNVAYIREIANIEIGIKEDLENLSNISSDTHITYPLLEQDRFANFGIKKEMLNRNISFEIKSPYIDLFDSKNKILINRNLGVLPRLNIAFSNQRIAFKSNIVGLELNRPNVRLKYLLALLSSRFYYNKLLLQKNNDNDLLKIGELSDLEIPILDIDTQLYFENIVDCLIYSYDNPKATLFFERLLDAMVYELFLEKELRNYGVYIMMYISKLPKIDTFTSEIERVNFVRELYEDISSPMHSLVAHLLSLLNIAQIAKIETNY